MAASIERRRDGRFGYWAKRAGSSGEDSRAAKGWGGRFVCRGEEDGDFGSGGGGRGGGGLQEPGAVRWVREQGTEQL